MATNTSISGGNNISCDITSGSDAERKQPFLVQAIYSFKGKNNDELCFKKGDIITVTQVEEGGWWEGTLGEKTGWFPSNYVNEYKLTNSGCLIGGIAGTTDGKSNSPVDLAAQQKVYRSVVLKDLIDSERAHLTEMQGLMHNFLIPLEKAEIMKNSEYNQLISNLHDVVNLHEDLLNSLVEVASLPGPEQRVGRIFLTVAPQLKQVLTKYCSNHPRSVCILDRYKQDLNKFMESNGAVSPGLLVLTAGLSKPFRRLEKYAGMLQELERHVEENHIDRGDTQRSVSVFKDIASLCSVIRRQKEMELEVISGGVRGWEGEDLSCLGDIIHMGSVAVGPEHHDRYLVLFPSTLLMLSVSHRMSAFIYEGKLPLAGISVNKLDDTSDTFKNAFEIVGPMIERIVAVCQTKEDQQTWVDLIRQQIRSIRVSSPLPSTPAPPPHSPIANNNIANITSSSSNVILQQSPHMQQQNIAQSSLLSRPWSVSCLRPSPPLRTLLTKDDKTSSNCTASQQSASPGHGQQRNSTRKQNERCFEEDAQILRVIEGYCASVKSRYTISSALLLDGHQNYHNSNNNNIATKSLTMPQLLIAEEEKIIMDDINVNNNSIISTTAPVTTIIPSITTSRNNSSNHTNYTKAPIIEEKSLVDTVYTLKEEVTTLYCKLAALSDRLQEERLARNQLQAIVNNCLLSNPVAAKNNLHLIPTQHPSSTNSTTAAN